MSADVKIVKTRTAASILADARDAGRNITRAAAERGVEVARRLCPVSDNNEPGHVHLRDTIEAEVDEQTGAATMVAGDPARGVNHAGVVEFGGVHTGPQPFFHQGMRAGQKEAARVAAAERRKG